MEKVIIYHNPKCSKSREALKLLIEKKVDFQIIEYLKDIPTEKELRNIIKKLKIEPIKLLRKGEDIYKELVSIQGKPDPDITISWMLKHPKLIERPIVVTEKGARIGRPTEVILEIL